MGAAQGREGSCIWGGRGASARSQWVGCAPPTPRVEAGGGHASHQPLSKEGGAFHPWEQQGTRRPHARVGHRGGGTTLPPAWEHCESAPLAPAVAPRADSDTHPGGRLVAVPRSLAASSQGLCPLHPGAWAGQGSGRHRPGMGTLVLWGGACTGLAASGHRLLSWEPRAPASPSARRVCAGRRCWARLRPGPPAETGPRAPLPLPPPLGSPPPPRPRAPSRLSWRLSLATAGVGRWATPGAGLRPAGPPATLLRC